MLMPDEVPDDAEPWENRPDAVVDIGGVDGQVVFHHGAEWFPGSEWLGISIWQAGHRVAGFSMDYDIAVRFANAILSEVEVARRPPWEPTHCSIEDGSTVRLVSPVSLMGPGWMVVENECGEAFSVRQAEWDTLVGE